MVTQILVATDHKLLGQKCSIIQNSTFYAGKFSLVKLNSVNMHSMSIAVPYVLHAIDGAIHSKFIVMISTKDSESE